MALSIKNLNLRSPGSRSFFTVSFFVLFALVLISPLSIITFSLFVTLILLIVLIFSHSRLYCHLTVFSFLFFTLIAVLIFCAQIVTLPEYGGLSGDEGGIGTDDTFYYTQATDDFQASRNGAVRASWSRTHNYSKILTSVNWIVSLYKKPHLIDFLLFNAFGLSFLPTLCFVIAKKTVFQETNNTVFIQGHFNAYWLTLLYPAFWIDGLILIRDGWTATLLAAGLLATISWQPVTLIIMLIVLAYFRIASTVTFLASMAPLFLMHLLHQKKMWQILAIFIIFAFSAVAMGQWHNEISNYFLVKNVSFLRSDFVEGFIGEAAQKKGSISFLYLISTMPTLIRIPVSFLFFLCLPFFSLTFIKFGIIIPRHVIGLVVTIVNFFYFSNSFKVIL